MPELPDVVVYIEALEQRIRGRKLERVLVGGPSLLRTADPPLSAAQGRTITELRRLGKRIAIGADNDVWLVLHLMIAGRLHWSDRSKIPDGRRTLAVFDFDSGYLTLTEAGSRKRASLHVSAGRRCTERARSRRIDVFEATLDEFGAALTAANHTLKRALTDPRTFSGIGNAYSDEILWAARLSPVALRNECPPARSPVCTSPRAILCVNGPSVFATKLPESFPKKVTAFREGMAVHGRYGQPCPRCGAKVQRIRYASNETNYCARCQTNGKLLADRALSRLLREDWPRTLEELEERRG